LFFGNFYFLRNYLLEMLKFKKIMSQSKIQKLVETKELLTSSQAIAKELS
jgi:hypothetical protein